MPKDKTMPYMDWESIMDDTTITKVSMAIKGLVTGTASPEEQQFILNFMIVEGCRTYDSDWFLDERISCFAAGRRSVGRQLARFAELNIGKLNLKQENKNG